ncbi:hypothetical protein [Chryseobacterium arthrosphaerae]|nr:hypothetical protein [Chryseobacterium arthrosphaerae]
MIAPQELRLGNYVKTLEGIFEIRAINQHSVTLSTGIITTYPALLSN